MKEIFRQLVTIWRAMKPIQRGAFAAIFFSIVCLLGFLLIHSSGNTYTPLYSGKSLTSHETSEIRNLLEQLSIHFKEDQKKGILVLSDQLEEVRLHLSNAGIPKQSQGKGFELFDTNTWIKGEKELQVLEMRALKGQLEKDLSAFENIKSASVILDIPPQRSFTAPKYQTKASVILTLMPKARLSPSQLRAIINHLTGAVRGLEADMVAISDTTGKLYKARGPSGEEAFFNTGALFEEHLEDKISALLERLVGEENFITSVQAILDKTSDKVSALSIGVMINKESALYENEELFRQELERQVAAVASGYGFEIKPAVDLISFGKSRQFAEKKRNIYPLSLFATLFFVTAALTSIIFAWRRSRKKKQEEESLFQMMTRIDLKKLAASIEHEDPQTIALMVSYLDPHRAEEMISSLNGELQEEVLLCLSELEKKQP
jgi:flagellar biosynthesis/type III secretory pathway M-ring protein FliF/YscJ